MAAAKVDEWAEWWAVPWAAMRVMKQVEMKA
jgi:hypothetical protein